MADPSVDFLRGTLDLMILKTLSWAPAHGYGIAQHVFRACRAGVTKEIGTGRGERESSMP